MVDIGLVEWVSELAAGDTIVMMWAVFCYAGGAI